MTWGFAIYRTAYGPQSHQLFPQVLKLINSSTKRAIFEEKSWSDAYAEPATYEAIGSRYHPVITNDSARGERDGISRRTCIVIDDEVLQTLADAVAQLPREAEEDVVDDHTTHLLKRKAWWWVKTVEAWPDLEELLMTMTGG
ncbi:hypothetical protein BJY00DRAFT_316156 [Aspergillus carlsbadensis]|nr:hypothetical protein BJY00DRAFT_316156 [Aspergillus carlsbadensis]